MEQVSSNSEVQLAYESFAKGYDVGADGVIEALIAFCHSGGELNSHNVNEWVAKYNHEGEGN
jgi:hypothetical protein